MTECVITPATNGAALACSIEPPFTAVQSSASHLPGRVGTGKRWFLADLLGEVKAVKGPGLTWEAAFADADREAALGLSTAGFCS
jgi:hypothetical protein